MKREFNIFGENPINDKLDKEGVITQNNDWLNKNCNHEKEVFRMVKLN